ncbi:CDP-glycerol glycerophosphotransferase family protein [Staphylococcus agnetis]|uniref:CDP-glycerol glycerophosphotransferase family protein n=1 Tax=Staphylococcus agnetis TaxID=985762 RepID=UPI000D1B761D|nr:CDP-glycerol glycerophosphotransferase family protein [Staphylococcus agnetis]PTH73533.1 CDP-glycerol--glycerophosphate glycerophosphotransferase [Staphylococcus agnetis]PTH74410.1 CDP-glycerol--glycerophosphate glycerophosphotransferase [Staphylococcus agnetis]
MGITKINQVDSKLTVSFENPTKSINKLFVKNEFESMTYLPVKPFTFEIDLIEVIRHFKPFNQNKIHLIIEESDALLTNQHQIKVSNQWTHLSNLQLVESDGTYLYPYVTKGGFLNFTFSDTLPTNTYVARRHIDKMKFNNSEALIEGKFTLTNATLLKANIVLRTRFKDNEQYVYLPVSKFGENIKQAMTSFAFQIDLYEELIQFLKQDFATGDVLDLFLEISIQESATPIRVKIGQPRIFAERFLKGEIITDFKDNIVSITPYLTMKGKNLSFRINTYSIESYLSYIKSLKTKSFPFGKSEDVWVIGEKSYKAQDNGLHFFKYLRTHHPDLPAYYIIEEDSNERANVEPYGNVIYFRSPEHFEIMLKANYICSTHHPELLYPTNSQVYTKKVKATKVFLQHGVLGTKNLTEINGNQLQDFNVDLFVTSSEREKEIVVRDLKFDEQQVLVTGLSRFDALFDNKTQTKKQILIIPTWRDWLTSTFTVKDSDYLKTYNALLNNDEWLKIHELGYEILFCLHPNMQPFIDLFDVPSHITSIKQGDIDVQQLIKESSLMVTDYSSVAFDFSFLDKPVLYYQFDTSRFLGKHPSHINLIEELPGVIVDNEDALLASLQHYIQTDFEVPAWLKARSRKFYSYRDQHNAQRIYENIRKKSQLRALKNKVQYDILSQHFFKRFRKHSKYFTIMDKMNSALVKWLPVKNNLVVFESNVGKSVSDSPKVIYDALAAYRNDMDIVWVNNTQYPFRDPNVKSVERLSPSYFYYLSRAKYWVNNQNFPHYIDKPSTTTYIQTWHGTPLKKMLNDVKTFEGRDAGYKDRVNHAIQKWDFLVSPSPYATKCFKSAFNFKKEVLEIGYPRNDIFYQAQDSKLEFKKANIKKQIGIHDNRKVILYAPTFRDDEINKAKKHIIQLKMDLQKMYRQLGEDYVLLLRPHIIISNALHIDENLSDFAINVGNYNEISDLYLISDICITDYSSVMFDFANTRKPMLFYTYDLDHYKNNLRGFYFDFEKDAPGPLIKTDDQLIEHILNIDDTAKTYQDKYEAFYNRFCTFETGTSAQHIVQRFFKKDSN